MNSQKSANILVVDDEKNWREALSDILEEEGYRVKAIENFDDALLEFEQSKYDLVILDIRLIDPDFFNVQGIELLKIIKGQKNPPKVVVLTGHPESIRGDVQIDYGADALVLKVPPHSKFDIPAFKDKIQEILSKTK
jgi:DNA-binding response OmpR family regulator